ncbi:SusC/RagA family TonB-linked outer membrane protein [Aegicerativicinus sediminis]|uniref:SusC/RagA family TonB-linked outer membrane protein n=1 Tax=Aegicerativicinus sediminis TaxID=2893202 RepID=UPI001E2BECBC|nr:SusC/RagA family TonB-linked outer membrane protein [Aegicerativicinus sediminis]
MKLTFLILFTAVISLHANDSYSQRKLINLQLQGVTIAQAIDEIEANSDFNFIFNIKDVDLTRTIDIQAMNVSIENVLNQMFGNTLTDFVIRNKQIILKDREISVSTAPKQQQNIRVVGTITDSNGFPLAGVTVLNGAKTLGVATDIDGKFSIALPSDTESIVVSYLGFETKTILLAEIADLTNVSITLNESTSQLDEVVVTGYQTLSKERTAGSFSKLTAEDIQQRPSSPNILERIRGQVAGLSVSPATGLINLRGRSTIFSSQETPLIVIDNFPMSDQTAFNLNNNLGSLNPEDIESITILKDASAASIWGARAANGVIVITTKKGTKNRKPTVAFSSFVELENKIDTDDFQWMNTEQEIELDQEFLDKGWYNLNSIANSTGSINDLHLAYIYRNGLSPDGNVWSENTFNNFIEELKGRNINKEFSKHFFRNALRVTHNLSMQGGGDNNTYFASLAYTDYQSANIGNDDDRITLTVNNTVDFSDKIKFTSLLSGGIRNQTLNSLSPSFGTAGAAEVFQQLQAYDQILDENGNLRQYYVGWNPWISQAREEEVGSPMTFNWLEERLNKNDSDMRMDLRARFQLDAEILKDLTVSSAFAYEINYYKSDTYNSMDLPSHRNFINDYYVDGEYQIPVGTDYAHDRNIRRGWVFRNSINWDKTWGDHQLTVLGIGEYSRFYSDNMFNRVYGYDEQSLQYIPASETLSAGVQNFNGNRLFSRPSDYFSKSEEDIRNVSFASNLAYTYKDKYTVNGSIRVEQANIWGSDPEFRYKPLWSVAAGWELGREDFMADVSWVDRLKLRASYGIGGISDNSSSPYAQAIPRSIFWGRPYIYSRLNVPSNPSLRWAEVATTNIGVDFALFGNKLSGTAEYYVRKSSDILGRRAVDPTNGWASATLNYAATDNKGFELSLNTDIISNDNFNWNVRANFNYNENIVTNFYGENNQEPSLLVNGGTFLQGDPFFNLYAYRFGEINDNGEFMAAKRDGTLVHWSDIPTEITLEDMVSVGTEIAPYYGGLTNTFTYKSFDLSVLVNYQAGHYFKNFVNYLTSSAGTYNNTSSTFGNVRTNKIWNDRWRQPGDEASTNIPRAYYAGINPRTGESEGGSGATSSQGFYWTSSDINYHKADFIRIQEIILGYNMPQKYIDKTFFTNLRLSFQITNPYLWTANDIDRDPEAFFDDAYVNLTRYTLGLRANF